MSDIARPGPSPAAAEEPRRLHGFALFSVLASLMLTLFLQALDQTVVGTALPKIVGVFHGFDRFTWVVTAYLLTVTTTIPIVGKLSAQFGRKVFSLSSVCGPVGLLAVQTELLLARSRVTNGGVRRAQAR